MVIDIIFVIAAVWGFYLGFSRGIIKTVFTILSFLFGLIAAFKFAPAATEFLKTTFNSGNPLMFLAGFLLSFVLTMLLIRMAAKALEGVLKTANINIINQFLGGVLLAGVMVLVYSAILWFGVSAHIVDERQAKQESMTYEYLINLPAQAGGVAQTVKPVFLEFWDRSVEMMDNLENMSEKSVSDPQFRDLPDDESSSDR